MNILMRVDKESDLWETPNWLFDELNAEFNFYIDICANSTNHKCHIYYKDYLNNISVHNKQEKIWPFYEFNGEDSFFMNPPYSNPLPFVKKAYDDSRYGKIVCLIKADTSTKTWAVFWDYDKHQPKPGVEVRFLPKRLKFERGGIPSKNCANFPSVIVIFDRRP